MTAFGARLLFAIFICFFLAAENETAPTLNSTDGSDGGVKVTSKEELMDEIVDLKQNLTDVWNAMAVLNERLEVLEDTNGDDGGTDGGSWHCGGDAEDNDESPRTATWASVLKNVTNPLTTLIAKITHVSHRGKANDSSAARVHHSKHDDNDDKEGGEDEDDEKEAKDDKDDDNDSGENKLKGDGEHRRQQEQNGGRKCSWRPNSKKSHLKNNEEEPRQNITRVCHVRPNKALPPEHRPEVRGLIVLTQKGTDKLVMTVKLTGLPPQPQPAGKQSGRKYGFHAHEDGNLTNGCESAGRHYNPFNFNHSGPSSPKRHLGDFGNLVSDESGVVDTELEFAVDNALSGKNSLLGRALVIHQLEDDLGSNPNDPGSMAFGNSGSRLACCVLRP